MVKPKKHLGQHFLTDGNIARKIVECLISDTSFIVEIGPGTGVLTKPILDSSLSFSKLKLIEIDGESVEYLNSNFEDSRLEVYEGDFLKMKPGEDLPDHFSVIGNFPYNISSQIFFKVLDYRNSIPEVVCMIQKEVAERIASPPGSKTYGILSVLLQAWYDIKYCFTVNENVFYPPPKVKSAVIRLSRNSTTELGCNEKLFINIVKTCFNHRRKTIRNTLKAILPDINQDDHRYFSMRPEQLSVNDFIELSTVVESFQSDK